MVSRGVLVIFGLSLVIVAVQMLLVSRKRMTECSEVKAWVFDEHSGMCLVRLKRFVTSMEKIVSGRSIGEMENHAQCTLRGLAGAIETGCWKKRGGPIDHWIGSAF